MKFIKKVLLTLLLIIIFYAAFSIKAYFDYKDNYQDCEKIKFPEIFPDPKMGCSDANSRLFWKILFSFGIPPYPRGYLM